jgi:hypothetical protein
MSPWPDRGAALLAVWPSGHQTARDANPVAWPGHGNQHGRRGETSRY